MLLSLVLTRVVLQTMLFLASKVVFFLDCNILVHRVEPQNKTRISKESREDKWLFSLLNSC